MSAATEATAVLARAVIAVARAENEARAAHDSGTCPDSEWSCSFCEAGE